MASPGRVFALAFFTFHDFLKHMFPHITGSLPGAPHELRGVWVGPGRIESVSDSGSTTSILSAAQSFATCSRNSLYLIFVAGYYSS
jgi:hypothetical protein